MKVDERELDRVEAIVLSMTPEERRRPELIKGSRRLRIARGSGTSVQQVNQLVKQFGQMRKLMKRCRARQDARHRRPRCARRADATALRPRTLSSCATRLRWPSGIRRLTRVGGSKDPIWRVVVADQRSPRDGRVIETIGHYNAQTDPSTIDVDVERARALAGPRRPADQQVRKLLRIAGHQTARSAPEAGLGGARAAGLLEYLARRASSTIPRRSRSSSSRRTTAPSCSSSPSPRTTTARSSAAAAAPPTRCASVVKAAAAREDRHVLVDIVD